MNIRHLVLTALFAAAPSCGSDATSPSALVGSYLLTEVNGKAPPQEIRLADGQSVSLVSGMITLSDDGGVTLSATTRAAGGRDELREERGAWALINGTITVRVQAFALAPSGTLLGWDDGRTWSTGIPGRDSSAAVFSFVRYRSITVVR